MKSTLETLGPTRVRLAVEVPFAELEPSLKKAYQEIARHVTVPGFRKGKVPATVIDQRVGRSAVLNEAVQEAIPQQLLAAVREHEVRTLGRPDLEVGEVVDGQPLKFTAEMDVRPVITLPDLGTIEVTVDEAEVADGDIDEQVNSLRERFATLKAVERPVREGDYVQVDLAATVDGEEVPGGTATNISHEVGGGQLLQGLDEALIGMSAGEEGSFTSQLVGGDFAGRDADVAVTLRAVKEKELPALDDDFAQLASEFDTLAELREDLRDRLRRVRRTEQVYKARDKALEEVVRLAGVPVPEGVVREEVADRKASILEQLQRIGASFDDYLAREGKTSEEVDAELTAAATEGLLIQLVLDALAEAEQIQVSDDEFGHEIVHRAQRSGVEPQQYYDELVRAGAVASVYGDVRRGKALAVLMDRVTMADSAGNPIRLEDLREPEEGAADHAH